MTLPSFYRPSGYKWIDFEKDYAVEPNLRDKNSNKKLKLEDLMKIIENKSIFIGGGPGSGKSTIIKYMGYKLVNKNKKVFILPLKDVRIPEEQRNSIISLIQQSVDKGFYIFIDDVHLDNYKIMSQLRGKGLKQVVFSGRVEKEKEIEKGLVSEKGKFEEHKPDYEPIVEETFKAIIEKFKEKYNVENLNEELFNHENLMILSIQLGGWELNRKISPPEEAVYDYTSEKTGYLNETFKRKSYEYDADEIRSILLAISFLYKYEIGINEDYITNLGFKEDYIENLADIKEVGLVNVLESKVGKRIVSLYYSSIAEVIIKAGETWEDFGKPLKSKLNLGKNLENMYNFYYDYLKQYPEEGAVILGELYFYNEEVINKLLNTQGFDGLVVEVIKKMNTITWKFRNFMERIGKIIEKIKAIYKGVFEEKIEKWDNLLDIGKLLYALQYVRYDMEWVRNIGSSVFEDKIKGWNNSEAIGGLLKALSDVGYDINRLDKEVFEEKIKERNNPLDIIYLLEALQYVRYDIDRLDKEVFEEKIKEWDDPLDIVYLLEALQYVRYDMEWVRNIGSSVFEDKIKRWDDPWDIGDLLKALKDVEYDISEIGSCVFEDKIKEWDSPWAIGILLKALKEAGYNMKWVKRIDKGVFEEKIKNWDEREDVEKLLKVLEDVGYDVRGLREIWNCRNYG